MAVKLYLTGVQKIIRGFIMSKIYSLEDAKNLFQTLLRKNMVMKKLISQIYHPLMLLTQLQMMNCTMYKQK